MTVPCTENPEITLNENGELEHYQPPVQNRRGETSHIGVRVSGDWIQVGCTRIHRDAWETILNEYYRNPFAPGKR